MKNEQELRKIISWGCEDFEDKVFNGIKENKDLFPYTIAVTNFISELKSKNIVVSLNAFGDTILDMIFREIKNYVAK